MRDVRPAAVAGMFYPGEPSALDALLERCFKDAAPRPGARGAQGPGSGHWPKAMIVPHAGYIYSGPIAASAYARLQSGRHAIRRVVLFGPAHRVAVRGLAVPSVDAFETPLGAVPIDHASIASLDDLPFIVRSDVAHAQEHSLEVQLPFLQRVLDRFTLVPFAVGLARGDQVATVMKRLWGGTRRSSS